MEKNIIETLRERKLSIATAESLTAGLVGSMICSISGASDFYKGGIISYTKEAKENVLGVAKEIIDKYGVYSHECAREMVLCAQKKMNSDCAISTTGVAGPGPDEDVPAGTVYFGFAVKDVITTEKKTFEGTRNEVRNSAALYAVTRMNEILNN